MNVRAFFSTVLGCAVLGTALGALIGEAVALEAVPPPHAFVAGILIGTASGLGVGALFGAIFTID